ncbi:MAG: glucosaminidase domain-containing protein [Dysgonamonadaceae bacterium]|jgi:hypothetical protein|nr:glucosaminidase domain-containing protein [Dysgonamonadaceae bacterium]
MPVFGQNQNQTQKNPEIVAYIEKYKNLAIMQMHKYKVPASIKLAQGILESKWGRSTLAAEHNNHFGIKADSRWPGLRVRYLTKEEYKKGEFVQEYHNFRKYNSVEESFEDHSLFLKQARYSALFLLDIHDITGWAYGLQRCGYATDSKYPGKLLSLISRYQLTQYDLKTFFKRTIFKDHGLPYILANEGESLEMIASDLNKNFNLDIDARKLKKYNELQNDDTLRDGAIIYLKKKHSKANKPYYEHPVSAGESAYQIAQMYGMRVKTLYRLNKQKINAGLTEGDVLRLR